MEIREYANRDGKAIFTDWWRKLKDRQARKKIHIQIDRLALGNTGDCKSLGGGVYELRIHYGPGYRVYFGTAGKRTIILLCGGNKASQHQDIHRAAQYLNEYRRR